MNNFQDYLKTLGFEFLYDVWVRKFQDDKIEISIDENEFLITFTIQDTEFIGNWLQIEQFLWHQIFLEFSQMQNLLDKYLPQ